MPVWLRRTHQSQTTTTVAPAPASGPRAASIERTSGATEPSAQLRDSSHWCPTALMGKGGVCVCAAPPPASLRREAVFSSGGTPCNAADTPAEAPRRIHGGGAAAPPAAAALSVQSPPRSSRCSGNANMWPSAGVVADPADALASKVCRPSNSATSTLAWLSIQCAAVSATLHEPAASDRSLRERRSARAGGSAETSGSTGRKTMAISVSTASLAGLCRSRLPCSRRRRSGAAGKGSR
mmetsp:Transcript_12742/g.38577  ORF Transcript_12742/g.38577 Transcript_12742/m.38577 type:complete len:238 (+) Transcript_12742:4714-5427(+)